MIFLQLQDKEVNGYYRNSTRIAERLDKPYLEHWILNQNITGFVFQ